MEFWNFCRWLKFRDKWNCWEARGKTAVKQKNRINSVKFFASLLAGRKTLQVNFGKVSWKYRKLFQKFIWWSARAWQTLKGSRNLPKPLKGVAPRSAEY